MELRASFIRRASRQNNNPPTLVNSIAGFAFLPFVWVVNVVWFFELAFKKPPFDEQNAIRKCKLTSFMTDQLYYETDHDSLLSLLSFSRCDILSNWIVRLVHRDSSLGVTIPSQQNCLGRDG